MEAFHEREVRQACSFASVLKQQGQVPGLTHSRIDQWLKVLQAECDHLRQVFRETEDRYRRSSILTEINTCEGAIYIFSNWVREQDELRRKAEEEHRRAVRALERQRSREQEYAKAWQDLENIWAELDGIRITRSAPIHQIEAILKSFDKYEAALNIIKTEFTYAHCNEAIRILQVLNQKRSFFRSLLQQAQAQKRNQEGSRSSSKSKKKQSPSDHFSLRSLAPRGDPAPFALRVSRPIPPPPPQTQRLSWNPLGERFESFEMVESYVRRFEAGHRERVHDLERLRLLYDLRPSKIYTGRDEFDGYLVFLFRSIAILECPVVGNALYALRGQWQILARKSKAELLEDKSGSVERIEHRGDWPARVRALIERPV